MKKMLLSMVIVGLCLIACFSTAFAETEEVYYWNEETEARDSAVVELIAENDYIYGYLPNGDVVIVAYYGHEERLDIEADFAGKNVVSINDNAFSDFAAAIKLRTTIIDGIEYPWSVTPYIFRFPESIKYIGYGAIRAIVVPNSEKLDFFNGEVVGFTFIQRGRLILENLPIGLRYIGSYACGGLNISTLPSLPNVILEEYAFDSIQSSLLIIENGLTAIPKYCFSGGTVKSFIIPESVTSIDPYAFLNSYNFSLTVVHDSYGEEWAKQWADEYGFKYTVITPVREITLDQTDLIISKGKTSKLAADIQPADASIQKLEWSSSDETVATVKSGTVTAKGSGTCTITCKSTDGSAIMAACNVEVRTPVKSVSINEKKVPLTVGSTEEAAVAQLTVTVKPEDAYYQTVNWSSSDETVATIDGNGLITALSAGKATITAQSTESDSKAKSQLKIVVNQAVTEIIPAEAEITVAVGKSVTLKADVAPDNATSKKLTWSSANESIASVSSSGKLKGVAVGDTVITVAAADEGGASADITVHVVVE